MIMWEYNVISSSGALEMMCSKIYDRWDFISIYDEYECLIQRYWRGGSEMVGQCTI